MEKDRRLKKVSLPREMADKHNFILALSKLPADAVVKEMTYNWNSSCFELIVFSSDFAELKLWEEPPSFDIAVSAGELEEIREYIETGEVSRGMQSFTKHETNVASINDQLKALGLNLGNQCICDMAYTGLRQHRRDCPQK